MVVGGGGGGLLVVGAGLGVIALPRSLCVHACRKFVSVCVRACVRVRVFVSVSVCESLGE